jgi:hypothetical protein
MKGRKIEELATNNVVLRLVTIETNRARELAEREKKRKAEADTEAYDTDFFKSLHPFLRNKSEGLINYYVL